VSGIKLAMLNKVYVNFDFIDEVSISNNTHYSGTIYNLEELSNAFGKEKIKFPKFVQPQTKKELHRNLSWYAVKLYYNSILNIDGLKATALIMNARLDDKFSEREVFKIAFSVHAFINNPSNSFRQKLPRAELKKILSSSGKKGGLLRGKQKTDEAKANKQKVIDLIQSNNYNKPNGKVNVTAIAHATKLHRTTVSSIINNLALFLVLLTTFNSFNYHSYHNTKGLKLHFYIHLRKKKQTQTPK